MNTNDSQISGEAENQCQQILQLVADHFAAGGTAFFVLYATKDFPILPQAHTTFFNEMKMKIRDADIARENKQGIDHLRWSLNAGWVPIVLERWFRTNANNSRSEREQLPAFVSQCPDEDFRRS